MNMSVAMVWGNSIIGVTEARIARVALSAGSDTNSSTQASNGGHAGWEPYYSGMVRLVVAFIVGAIIGWRFVKGWSTAGELATVAVLILGVSFLRLTRLHGFYFAMWELSALAVVVLYWRFFAKRIPYPAELLARWQRRGSEHSARDRSLRRIRPYAEAGALAGLGLLALFVVSSLGLSFTRIAAIREHIERWHWLATVALFYGSSVLIVLGDRAFVRKSDPHAHDGAL